jgi:Bardet-Biedl syndrome 7 protein
VVGHEDGALEVWDVDPQGQPQLMASAQLPESITSVAGGYVTNAGSPDIIVHTFTGKVWVARGHWTAVGMRARV